MSGRLATFAASLALTLGVLLLAEFGVRLAGTQPQPWPTLGMERDFSGVRVDPLLGPLPIPGWSGRWFGEFESRFDEHGFRAPAGEPPSGAAAQVVFFGDSCMFGWGVGTGETFLTLLDERQRQAGDPICFKNASYPGLSAVSGAHHLRERVLPLHPSRVILGFSANNAFRFSVASDSDRFRSFGLRKMLLRSRLFHLGAAWLANRQANRPHPRDRRAIGALPVSALKRVASPTDFEDSLRTMVRDSRAAGATVMLLIFPRASEVSEAFRYEDAAVAVSDTSAAATLAQSGTGRREVDLLEVSCIEPAGLTDVASELHQRSGDWQAVFPASPLLLELLRDGARDYAQGSLAAAARRFEEAVRLEPRSPLARYDLGVARLATDDAAGLGDLAEADRLACSVFLHYQVVVWRVAQDLGVPVVDLTLYAQQAADAGELFLDPAHLNAAGQRLVADALWPLVVADLPERRKDI